MLKKLYYDLIPLILMITMFIFSINFALGMENSAIPFITKMQNPTDSSLFIYKFEFKQYIDNLTNSISNSLQDLMPKPNQITWREVSGLDALDDFANNFFYVINTFIYVINLMTTPIRIIGWVGMNLLVILGQVREPTTINNITYEPTILMEIFKFWAIDLQIPMIQP